MQDGNHHAGWQPKQHSAGLDVAPTGRVGNLASSRQQISVQAPHESRLPTDALATEELPGAVVTRLSERTEQPAQHRLSVRPRDLKDAADLFHLRKLAAHVMKVTSHQLIVVALPSCLQDRNDEFRNRQ